MEINPSSMTEINYSELLPDIQKAIEFVAVAATGGVIGNRVDHWFVNLYYHEQQRLLQWLRSWVISDADKKQINNNEKLKILFSQVTIGVANEIFDQKLLIWPIITESLLRNSNFEFDKKQYFISLFLKLEPFTIHYLATLYIDGPIPISEVFGKKENHEPENLGYNLGQLQSAFTGTTEMTTRADKISCLGITVFGREFIEFISNSSIAKIKEMAGQRF